MAVVTKSIQHVGQSARICSCPVLISSPTGLVNDKQHHCEVSQSATGALCAAGIPSLRAGSLVLADVSLTQGRACGAKLSWHNYIIKEHGNVQKQ